MSDRNRARQTTGSLLMNSLWTDGRTRVASLSSTCTFECRRRTETIVCASDKTRTTKWTNECSLHTYQCTAFHFDIPVWIRRVFDVLLGYGFPQFIFFPDQLRIRYRFVWRRVSHFKRRCSTAQKNRRRLGERRFGGTGKKFSTRLIICLFSYQITSKTTWPTSK